MSVDAETKRAAELEAFAQTTADAAIAVVKRVIAEGQAGTLDVSAVGSGIECDQRGFARLQRVVDGLARVFAITGYVVPQPMSLLFPGWTLVFSPRIPDPRVTALTAEVETLRQRMDEMHQRLFGGEGLP